MRAFDAMGTRFECVLVAFSRAMQPFEPVAIAEEIELLIKDWHARLSVFDETSCVSVINRIAADTPVTIDRELLALIRRCLHAARMTDGAFDISLGSLMQAHGFRPTPAETAPARFGWRSVRLDEHASTIRFTQPGIRLDFGGVAKGFALDLARNELRAQGLVSGLLHGGTSSVVGIGLSPDGRPWRVRATPDDPSAPVVDLTDLAMSVSAPTGRMANGKGHIMDGRSASPSSGCLAACVVGPSAEVCEVWSTTLVVEPALLDALPPGFQASIRRDDLWSSSGQPVPFDPSPSICSEVHEHVRV
ncbi:MAG: FAD:protein FMN transferase [Planctomycetota bacterium]|nr:MAG: FAD:protein FMN transferase [Planctomycetota bacterium]